MTENDLKLKVNDEEYPFQLENLFLFMLENFSDKNYNDNPSSYDYLMFVIGKFVFASNK